MILTILLINFFFQVPNCINGKFYNVSDPLSLLNDINGNQCLGSGNIVGPGILLTIWLILGLVFSYRAIIINAFFASSIVAFVIAILLNQVGVISAGFVMLFAGLMILFGMIAMLRGLMNPFGSS